MDVHENQVNVLFLGGNGFIEQIDQDVHRLSKLNVFIACFLEYGTANQSVIFRFVIYDDNTIVHGNTSFYV